MIGFGDATLMIIISLSGGLASGTAIISFLIALDIIPRLVQLTDTPQYSLLYEIILVLGIVIFTLAHFLPTRLSFGNLFAIIVGLYMGIFIGMLAGALEEVLNVIPIMAERLNLEQRVIYIMLALSIGKVFGSLIYWLIPSIYQ